MARNKYTTIQVTKEALAGFRVLAEQDKRTQFAEFEWLIAEELKRRAPVVGVIRDGKVEIKQ